MRIPEPTALMLDLEQCRLYNKYASNYDSLQEYIDLYKRTIGIVSGNIVDLGSGSCNFVIALANHFPNLKFTCYEESEAMISVANDNIASHNLTNRITVIKDNLFNAAGNYDIVLANRVLHHIEDTDSFWKLINKLSDNILVVDINRPPAEVINKIECADPIYKDDLVNSMKAAYTLEEVWGQIKQYGYTVSTDSKYKLIVYHTK